MLKNLHKTNSDFRLFGFDIKENITADEFIYRTINLDGSFSGIEDNKFDFVVS